MLVLELHYSLTKPLELQDCDFYSSRALTDLLLRPNWSRFLELLLLNQLPQKSTFRKKDWSFLLPASNVRALKKIWKN